MLKGKNRGNFFFKFRGGKRRRLAFKTKTMNGQFGLSTFYKNHFFLMRSFWAQKFINSLLIQGKKKVLLRVFFNLMVFFKNITFPRVFNEKELGLDRNEASGFRSFKAESKRLRVRQLTTQKQLFEKISQLTSKVRRRIKLDQKQKALSFSKLRIRKKYLKPFIAAEVTPTGEQSAFLSFLKQSTPEHYTGRLLYNEIKKKLIDGVIDIKHYIHFYREAHFKRELFRVSDMMLSADLTLEGKDKRRGYFTVLGSSANFKKPASLQKTLQGRQMSVAKLSHRVFSMGDRYSAVRFYWFFKSMEAARSSIYIEKRYIRRGVFYFVKLIPWWRQYTLVLRRLKFALRSSEEFTRVDGVGLEDKLKVEFLSTILGDESKSQLLLGKAETVSLLCEGRLKVHFRWKWR